MKIRLPEGTALIIPPQKQDYEAERANEGADEGKAKEKDGATTTTTKKKHWIICLFTSRQFGKNVSPPDTILANTELAIADMKEQLARLAVSTTDEGEEDGGSSGMSAPGELWSCRFNSGLFRVEWSRSRRVMEEAWLEVTVVCPVGEKL